MKRKEKLDVLVISAAYPPDPGGVAAHVYYLAYALSKLTRRRTSDRRICNVHVLTTGDTRSAEGKPPYLTIHRLPGKGRHFSSVGDVPLETVIQYGLDNWRRMRPDVVHVHDFESVLVGQMLKAAFRVPLIVTIHKVPKEWDPMLPKRDVKDCFLQAMLDLDMADAFVAPSRAYRSRLLDQGFLDRKIELIHHGIPVWWLASRAQMAAHFDRLAAGLALDDSTPADSVGLIFLWAATGLCRQIPVPAGRWKASLRRLLELSQPAGDWPLGHSLGVGNEAVVPSGEVASAFLNTLLSQRSRGQWSADLAMEVLAYIRPLAERTLREARSVRLRAGKSVRGWVDTRLGNDAGLLQAWTTASHILLLSRLFFVLQHAIRTVVISKFKQAELAALPAPGFARSPDAPEIEEVDSRAPIAEFIWNTFIRSIDPLAPRLADYRRQCNRGTMPRVEQERLILPASKNVSLILYGPPGTGKTTYVRALANVLEWPLITITPGNFIQRGESGIETAAQEIFESLMKIDRVVVLLDDCDELFRRRDRQETGTRTLLNFLTASMLPKLAALHDKGGLMFVIATNYLEEMDLAAIRGGRIDHHVAVPLPDERARRRILRDQIRKAQIANRYRRAVEKPVVSRDAIRKTSGLARGEITKAIELFTDALRSSPSTSATEAVKVFRESLHAATTGRLNELPLLVDFYGHMRNHSEPVRLAGARWRAPDEVSRAIRTRSVA